MQMRRVCVVWPSPRLGRIRSSLEAADLRYEQMDGLSALPQFGYEVDVLDSTPFPWNPLERAGSLWAGLDPVRFCRQIFHYRRWDAFICMGDSSCYFLVNLKTTLSLKTPILLIDPSIDLFYEKRRQLQHQVLPKVSCVVVFGAAQINYLKEIYGGRVRSELVLHRIDTRFFDPSHVTSYSDGSQDDYILSVGKDGMRDYPTLSAAVEGLSLKTRVLSSMKLDLNRVRNLEIHPEWISFERLREWYHGAKLVVMTTRSCLHAGGINGILEAMSMGKPLIASASAGVADYLQSGKTAIVVPPEDPKSLRAAIDLLLREPAFAAELGKNARQYCEQNVAIPLYARQIADLLDRTIEATRS